MAQSPTWKVYTANKEYIASVKLPDYGAMILAGIGQSGATLRYGHNKIVWTDFIDGDASESYDKVAEIAYKNIIVMD